MDEYGEKQTKQICTITPKLKNKINLQGIIDENKPLSINQMIKTYTKEQISELGKEGTYLNNNTPIDLEKAAKIKADYIAAEKAYKKQQAQKKQEAEKTNEKKVDEKTETPKI
jgi:hypothetical protein